jgi:hypothetical protein
MSNTSYRLYENKFGDTLLVVQQDQGELRGHWINPDGSPVKGIVPEGTKYDNNTLSSSFTLKDEVCITDVSSKDEAEVV